MTTVMSTTQTTSSEVEDNPDVTVGSPKYDPVVAAGSLQQLLRRHREDGDRRRRLTGEVVAGLVDAGQFRTQVSRRYGGLECDASTVLEATAEVSKGDASAGWLVMILSCAD